MKFQIVIAALAILLLPDHCAASPARLQCAGGVPDNRGDGSGIIYENTGFLTADFTQKACAAAHGSIDPNKKGNQKCCSLTDDHVGDFNTACQSQKAGSNYANNSPFPRGC